MRGRPKKTPSRVPSAIVARLAGRSIVLVGMMGAGKTAVGKRLAAHLGLPFFDADSEIEAAAQKSIPEIFASDGEAFFRDKEQRIISRLLMAQAPIVLATGGGAYMNAQTRQLLRERAISIWLRAEADVLIRRVQRKPNRPLLQTANPEATLRELMNVRDPVYAQADLMVESPDAPHEAVLEDVVRALADYVEENVS